LSLYDHFDLYYSQFAKIAQDRFINIDTSHRCKLECAFCIRQDPRDWAGKEFVKQAGKKYGDLTKEDARIMGNTYKKLFLCGQISDPIYHKDLLGIIEVLNETSFKHLEIHTNGSGKSSMWWEKLIHLLKEGRYTSNIIFGIDGINEACSTHRKNQDWNSAVTAMDICAEKTEGHENIKISWQYIPFEYNENDIPTAINYAKERGIEFILHRSSRFNGPFGNPVAPPKNPFHMSDNGLTSSYIIDDVDKYIEERDNYAA